MNPEHLKELTTTIYGESGAFFIPPDWNMTRWANHWHNCLELTLVLSGQLRSEVDGETYLISADQLLIIPPCALHNGFCLTEDTVYRTVKVELSELLNATKASTKCITAFLERKVRFCPLFTDGETVSLVKEMLEANDKDQHFRVLSSFYKLLDLLYTGSAAELENSRSGDFYEVLHYIEENLGSPLSTKSICSVFNYNETYFCRKFKKHTGLTVTKYILLHRLEIACQLLRNKERHVGDICSECGFSDFSFFTASFKKVYGVTPTQFRQLLNTKP